MTIRYIDKATCKRWDKILEQFDPTEHEGGAHNPYRPGWYWSDQAGTERGPFATRQLAQENQQQEALEVDAYTVKPPISE